MEMNQVNNNAGDVNNLNISKEVRIRIQELKEMAEGWLDKFRKSHRISIEDFLSGLLMMQVETARILQDLVKETT